jgi:hypothetical protein
LSCNSLKDIFTGLIKVCLDIELLSNLVEVKEMSDSIFNQDSNLGLEHREGSWDVEVAVACISDCVEALLEWTSEAFFRESNNLIISVPLHDSHRHAPFLKRLLSSCSLSYLVLRVLVGWGKQRSFTSLDGCSRCLRRRWSLINWLVYVEGVICFENHMEESADEFCVRRVSHVDDEVSLESLSGHHFSKAYCL